MKTHDGLMRLKLLMFLIGFVLFVLCEPAGGQQPGTVEAARANAADLPPYSPR
jgi:hypothetical protein